MSVIPEAPQILDLFQKFKPPTDYAFLFGAAPVILFAAGVVVGAATLKSSSRVGRYVIFWAACCIASSLLFSFLNERYLWTYPPGVGCPGAGPEGYTTVAPLFMPDDTRPFAPEGSEFDRLTCSDFRDIMKRDAAPGVLATLGALTASLGGAALFLGMIIAGAHRLWRPNQVE